MLFKSNNSFSFSQGGKDQDITVCVMMDAILHNTDHILYMLSQCYRVTGGRMTAEYMEISYIEKHVLCCSIYMVHVIPHQKMVKVVKVVWKF